METENGNRAINNPLFGLLAIPVTIAIMLAMMLAATWKVADYDESNWNTLLMLTTVLLAGGLLGKAPRIIFEPVGTRPSLVSLGFAMLIGAAGLFCINVGAALIGLVFTVTAIGVHIFDRAKRHEEEIILLGIVAGFLYGIQVAVAGNSWASEGTLNAEYTVYNLIDVDRTVTGYLFFTWWILSILISVVIALAMRGRLQNAGKGSWFCKLPEKLEHDYIPLFAGLMTWVSAHGLSLWHLHSLESADAIWLGHHIGFFWAFFTGLIAMFVAYCWAEHWRTMGGLIAVNWIIYSLGNFQDMGMYNPEVLTGGLGVFTWFGIFFWANSAVLWAGFTGKLLRVPERRQAGLARQWWGQHWYGITVGAALLTALTVRTLWNVIPAMNAAGTGEWDMTGGSDPWYMKRAVDYILAQNSHFVIDMDRSYPIGSINPRPPLFTWTLALGGELLNPFLAGDANDAVWWSVAGLPALYGALTVLPIAATCRRFFGAGAGAVGAWLIALMPGHVSHSTFALADHDAFVILFMSLGFYFWLCAVECAGSDRLLETSHWNPLHMLKGIQASFTKHAQAMAYAILAGVSIATVALGWKGFVYGLAIIYAAYFVQTALNLLRRRDSMPLTSAAIVMMITAFLLPLPFYGNLQLNLLWDASGFQPMFYILGFTVINGWVVTSFRDKPWLMVLVMGGGVLTFVLGTLYLLQVLEIYNGWDILFTGGFYFSKNKIFGTIAEAQAPSRGQLFANFGPLVFLLSLGMGFVCLWRGVRHRKQPEIVLSVWILVASYMAWSAGRFMFNATPAMAIMGASAIGGLWRVGGAKEYAKTWRRLGSSGSRARFSSTLGASRKHPGVPAVMLVLLMLFSQHAIYGLDSGIPRSETSAKQVDATIHDIMPDILRKDLLGWSVFDGSPYMDYGIDDDEAATCQGQCWYMGTFGPGFNGRSWNQAYEWLEQQDADESFTERPAFVSWWDYGFQALAQGQHPTVADNFQSGIPAAGNMLLAGGEHDTLALYIATLAEGDMRYEVTNDPLDEDGERFTPAFHNVMMQQMSTDTWDEWVAISKLPNGQAVADRAFTVIGSADDVVLAEGHLMQSDGTLEENTTFRLYEDGEFFGEYTSLNDAKTHFDIESNINWGEDGFSAAATHYIIGDYWYTSDLVDDFDDVSTSLHRQNARYAFTRDFLMTVFTMPELVDIYHGLTSIEYEVATYDGGPGETVVRNHDIRYFAVDNRLYPIGGYQYDDQNLHYGNPTGIFYAPTTLSGLDPDQYLESIYITKRGAQPEQAMTGAEFEEAYMNDILTAQSGTGTDMIELVDVLVEHQPSFFDTMIARSYIGYGSTQLGLDISAEDRTSAQPAQHLSSYAYGTPNTPLMFARPLPGAMMNHFVIANWYNSGEDLGLGDANTGVKILKYYSGATIEGDVVLGEIGTVPNAKLLIERDAFSGEDVEDFDSRTYWVPIATANADDEGHFSIRVPSGRIRISAFMGESNLDIARDEMRSSVADQGQSAQAWLIDMVTDENEERQVNPITGILGNVSGSTWLGETTVHVNGVDGHSNGASVLTASIEIDASGASGTVNWEGEGEFGDQPLANMDLRISNIWDMSRQDAYHITTSVGEVEGEREYGPSATGEVTFTGPGTMMSEGVVTATDFTGSYTRMILHDHSFTGEGTVAGRGILVGSIDGDPAPPCVNNTMAENATYCLPDSNITNTFMIDGMVEGISGRFTANETASFISSLYRETIIGAGYFEVDTSDTNLTTYGTINGTGVFQGTGQFSGEMVKPGSFHLVDAIPGTYHVAVLFDNGEEVVLPMPLEIPLDPVKDIELKLPGTWIQGDAKLMSGEIVTGRMEIISANDLEADVNESCGEVVWAPCYFETDEEGSFGIGPVLQGEYFLVMDADEDGYDEYRSNLIRVTPDTGENITADNVDNIPPMYDIDFTLIDSTGQPLEGENVTFVNMFAGIGIDARDNGNGSYNVELAIGEWVATGTLDEDQILYEEVEIVDADLEGMILQFVQSEWVNGSVMYEPNDKLGDLEPHKNQMVVAQWGGIAEDTMTDDDGNFSFQLPVGAEVNLTVHVVVGDRMVGHHFIVGEEDLPNDGVMMPQSTFGADGDLFLYREGVYYDAQVPGYGNYMFLLEAYHHETGVTWQWPVDSNGRFSSHVIQPTENGTSNWTYSINEPTLNVATIDHQAIGDNNTLKMIASPEHVLVTVSPFIDHEMDGNISNGTTQRVDFTLHPTSAFDASSSINISANDTCDPGATMNCWNNVTNSILLELEVGNWIFEMTGIDPRDEANATPFNTLISVLEDGDESPGANGDNRFNVPIGNVSMDVDVGFVPQWHTSATLLNEIGEPLENWSVKFEEADGIRQFSVLTDENGTIVDYLAEGDWIVVVDAFIQDDGNDENDDPMQEFRGHILIDSAQTGIVWQTVETAHFNLTLIEEGSNETLNGFSVIATSDTLGEITLGPSDEDGVISGDLMEGTWTLSLNRTDNNLRWVLENYTLTVGAGSANPDTNLTLSKWVEIAGNLFWDLNDDDAWNVGEGIADANVTVNGTQYGPVDLVTDMMGTWRAFVPVNDNYTVVANKSGYSPGSTTIAVDYAVNTSDLELIPGIVTVGGMISHSLPSEWHLIADDVNITLIPESGLSRQSQYPTKVLDNGTWDGTWTADIEPGNWIMHVTYNGTEGRFAAMTLLDAEVAEGGQANVTLSTASVLNIGTSWFDFDGTEHTLAETELITSSSELILANGLTMRWNATVDSNGELSLLLPAGDYTVDGSFTTLERETEMSYDGGLSAEVVGGGVESPDHIVSFNRRLDHSLSFSVGEGFVNVTQESNDNDVFTIIEGDDNEYLVATVPVDVAYEGNEGMDSYDLTVVMNGADASFWTVEIWNGTNETGVEQWELTREYQLGLDNIMNDTIVLRVIPANMSTAQSYSTGHSLLLKMAHDDGSYSEYELIFSVPQRYNFQSEVPDDAIVGVTPGTDETYSFDIVNTGNGDDLYQFDISWNDDNPELEGWGIQGAMAVPVGPGETQPYSLNIHAPTDSPDVEFSVWVTVTSDDNTSYTPFEVTIKTALPDLAITDFGVIGQSKSGFAIADQVNVFFVNVENTGIVDADIVTVEILNASGSVVGVSSAPIPSGEVIPFEISVDTTPYEPGSNDFTLHINTTGYQVADQPDDEIFQVNIQKKAPENASYWLGILVAVMFFGLMYMLWKFTGRRGAQPF
ncbi:MAG: STT3 domain-containing protein [Candidatus Thalassarchaeaceae archaeon]|nr:STT3 domain-containing protein [Candidatus Thalassarchaeaceae archaeon]